MQGARRRTRSRDPGVTAWAEGRCLTPEPPRLPEACDLNRCLGGTKLRRQEITHLSMKVESRGGHGQENPKKHQQDLIVLKHRPSHALVMKLQTREIEGVVSEPLAVTALRDPWHVPVTPKLSSAHILRIAHHVGAP